MNENSVHDDSLRLFDDIPSLIWRADIDSARNFFNRSWLEFTGHSLEQELGDGWLQSIHPEDRARVVNTYQAAFQRRLPFDVEYRLRHHTGEYRWILDTGRPYYDDSKKYCGYLGSCQDLTGRKNLEITLRSREAMFKSLFEHAPDAVVVVNRQGKIMLANERVQAVFGYLPEELHGRPFDYLMPASTETNPDYLGPFWENPQVRQLRVDRRLYGRRKNGQEFPAEIMVGPIDTGDELMVLATFRDISSRLETQEALREREQMIFSAIRTAPMVFFRIDREGIIQLAIGRSLSDQLGRGVSVGHSIYELFKDMPPLIEGFERAMQGESFKTSIEVEGLVYEATYRPMYNTKAEIDGVVGVASDITEHRQVEDALRKSEARFRMMFENADLGIKLIDLEGRIVEVNPAMQRMLGYQYHELLGKPFTELTHPLDLKKHQELFNALLAGKLDNYRIEKRYQRKDGSILWGSLVMSLFRGQDGKPSYAIGMVEDITPQKQMQAELAELHRRLLEGREVERITLAQELHDVPIQDLQGALYLVSGMLQGDPEGTPKHEQLLLLEAQIRQVIQTLRGVVGELRPPSLAPFGLEKAIRSYVDQIHQRNPDLVFDLQLTSDGQQIAERVRLALFRILQSSLNNTLQHAKAKQVSIQFSFDDDQISLVIQDDGQGFTVPRRWIELVRKGHYGLVGSIERAEAIGGQVIVESKPGQGTHIKVIVPRHEELQVAPGEHLLAAVLAES